MDHVYLMLPSVEVRSRVRQQAYKDYKALKNDTVTNELFEALFGEEGELDTFNNWFKEEQKEGNYIPQENDAYLTKASIGKGINNIIKTDANGNLTSLDVEKLSKLSKEKRNNLILDIFMQVLSQPQCIGQQLKPGGFEDASKEAAFMTLTKNISAENFLKEAYIEGEVNVDNVYKAYKELSKLGKKAMQKKAQKYIPQLNPLNVDTQLYFHSQNANGGKMIGVYAVGNAAHCINEWGITSLNSPVNVFGRNIQKLDNVYDLTGKALISENIAQFLAASVDNVKDPVLAALNQNTDTGDLTLLLLRAGIPLNEVALIMTAPYEVLDTRDSEAVGNAAKAYQYMLSRGSFDIPHLLAYKLNVPLTDSYGEIERDDFGKAISYMMTILSKNASDLTQITQVMRGDALSSAAGPTIGDDIVKCIKILNLIDKDSKDKLTVSTNLIDLYSLINSSNFNKESLLDDSFKQGSPFVYAATKCGVAGALQLFKTMFPQVNSDLLRLIIDKEYGLASIIPLNRIDAPLINSFFSELYLYSLQGTRYFGGKDIEETRNKNLYYLTKFPDVFNDFKTKYPKLASSNSLLKNLYRNNKGAYNRILFNNSGNLTKQLKETIMNDWAMLLVTSANSEYTEEQAEEIRNMGFELFKYASNFGLTFGNGSSFIHLAPNILRRAIKDYDSTIRNISFSDDLVPFVKQFFRNHTSDMSIRTISSKNLKWATDKDNQQHPYLVIKRGQEIPSFFKTRDYQTQTDYYFEIDNVDKREISGSIEEGTVYYKVVNPLGIPKSFREYYYGINNNDTIINTATYNDDTFAEKDDLYTPLPSINDMEDDVIDVTIGNISSDNKVYDDKGNLIEMC